MRVIVPLAGPDFVQDDGNLKAEINFGGEPLLRRVLSSRPWATVVTNYSFIMIDAPETRKFAATSLANWYPGSSVIFISSYTRGAALSSLAGIATGQDVDAPIIVDLADISYSTSLDPAAVLERNPRCGGIALTFHDTSPIYSYISLDRDGYFDRAAEKRVISGHASAGTYIFRDMATYLRALAHNLEHQEKQTFRGLFFVCPLFNGVKDQGKHVLLEPVTDVVDLKIDKNT